ncbi:MAG TPA: VCBS repeat-containing protein [Thermoanaerobaculia bacterium]|nr:VCBS repeat-containing protein [Thermoanaerobaculia bacterium]
MQPRRRLAPAATILLALLLATAPARGERLRLRELSLDVPASPATVVSADLDHDGVRDLLVLLVYTKWDQKVEEERTEMSEVGEMVAMMTIVPALLDHRELWWLRGDTQGGYRRGAEPLPLPLEVHALLVASPPAEVLALTDQGVDEVVLRDGALVLAPRLQAASRLAGTGVFLSGLDLLADLDGDGRAELLFPSPQGLDVYRVAGEGPWGEPLSRVALPAIDPPSSPLTLRYPLPEVRDVSGDGKPDLVFRDPDHDWQHPWVAVNQGGGRFAAAIAPLPAPPEPRPQPRRREGENAPPAPPVPVYYGDLDGDGRAEVVTDEHHEPGDDAGMREDIRDAELPRGTLRIFHTAGDLGPAATPAATFPIEGYVFDLGSESKFRLPAGFRDLDGDGRLDLVSIELGISIPRLLGGLALGHVALPMSFHVWCQRADGGFAPVGGLDLSGKFRVELSDLEVHSLPSFAGDFDGDHRVDFVQLGHGRDVSIHRGAAGCRFPSAPDLTLKLREEPAHLDLVRVGDLDGDGRADLMVVAPGEAPEPGVTPPARLDVYLSGGER